MSKVYVLHHDDSDGYCSALAAYLKFKDNATYIPVQYNRPFPDIQIDEDTDVYILDFCYDRVILDEITIRANKLVVIDHHEGSDTILDGLENSMFDKDHAGCVLSWKHFHPNTMPPVLFKLVEDRDLWRFKYDTSKDLEAGLRGSGRYRDLKFWNDLLDNSQKLNDLLEKGKILTESVNGRVKSFVNNPSRYKIVTLEGLRAAFYNTTIDVSELGEAFYSHPELNIDYTISYFITNDGTVVFSFRSSKSKNVSVYDIAKQFGTMFGLEAIKAGGHINASGANFRPNDGLEIIKRIYSL